MSRVTAWSLGMLSVAAAWIAGVAPLARAHEDQRENRRIEIVRRGGGHLGVVLRDVEAKDLAALKLGEERGAVVQEVQPDTPAAKAGLKEGDVIVRYQGETVTSVAQLSRLIRETPAGRKVAIEASRDGGVQKLQATLEEGSNRMAGNFDFDFDMPVPPVPPVPPMPPGGPMEFLGKDNAIFFHRFGDAGPRKLGIEFQELSGQLARYFKVDGGILVSSVDEGSPAAKAGIKAGDVLVKIDGKAVKDARDLHDAMESLKRGQETSVTVARDGRPTDFKVTIGGPEEHRHRGETT
jgi:serine protease Do